VVACASAWLAKALKQDPAQAFLAGMMHDVGCLALLSVLSTGAHSKGKVISPGTAMPILCNLHADAGALVAQNWALDEDVIAAIRLHHVVAEATVRKSTLIVALADAAEEIHHPDAEEHMRELMNHPARMELGIGHTECLDLVHIIADTRADSTIAMLAGGA
jgi:HD-like signal output (HDOD) protein